MISALPEK
jgi:transposase